VRKGGLADLLRDMPLAVLDEAGSDIRTAQSLPCSYLLSDHHDFSPEERALIEGLPAYSVGLLSLHADHTITIVLNEIDRRRSQ
jgi:tRNA (pseudouridine54-N1)-methyltransferase